MILGATYAAMMGLDVAKRRAQVVSDDFFAGAHRVPGCEMAGEGWGLE
jgi:hypothetical protein